MVSKTSKILGPDGRPIQIKSLNESSIDEAATGRRITHHENQASGLTPEKLSRILKGAQTGDIKDYLTLAEDMEERYIHYGSQLQTRKLALENIDPVISAKDEVPSKIIDAVEELVLNDSFTDAMGDLGDGIGKGFAAVEMNWEYEQGALKPVEYVYRDPRYFKFDKLTMSELRLANGQGDGEELAQAKFIRHMPRTKAGIPIRSGLARPVAWAFLMQTFALQDWAALAEVFGLPIRIGRYHQGASMDDKRTLLRAVTNIANDAAVIIPNGMDIEFQETNGARGEAMFGGLLDYLDKQVSKIVVGQTMTADDGASLGQAKVHNEVRIDLSRADGKQLAATANRDVIKPFVDLNFGKQEHYPLLSYPVADPEDIEALTSAIGTMVPFGLRVGQDEVRRKIGLSDPAKDEEILTVPGSPKEEHKKTEKLSAELHTHSTGECDCPTCLSTFATKAEQKLDANKILDEAMLEELTSWQSVSDPLVNPLLDIIENSTSLEEALAKLESKGPDASALFKRLQYLTGIARATGDATD